MWKVTSFHMDFVTKSIVMGGKWNGLPKLSSVTSVYKIL